MANKLPSRTSHLLALLRAALWGETSLQSLTPRQLSEAMKLAKGHTVSALAAQPILNNTVALELSPAEQGAKRALVLSLLQQQQGHQALHLRFSQAVAQLAALLEGAGIRYVLFKGLAASTHYPQPALRTMGDVDFYVIPADYERALHTLEQGLALTVKRDPTDKHDSFEHAGLLFEMHYRIETFGRTLHQQRFDQWIDGAIAQGQVAHFTVAEQRVAMPQPEADVLIVFKHLFNHLLVEGVGLRQVCDLAILLHDYADRIDVELLRRQLRAVGYLRAFDAFVALLHEQLALPCAARYVPLRPADYAAGRRLFALVMESGNFGRLGAKHRREGWRKSFETARRALHHCCVAFPLIPSEIFAFVGKRSGITLRKYLNRIV